MKDTIDNLKSYNINSFMQIGLEDPWPEDEKIITGSLDDIDPKVYKIPTKVEDDVYAAYRYINGSSPTVVYIPRKEIMLKLMRACIDVKNPKDLWFN